jgi:hypothetical protein
VRRIPLQRPNKTSRAGRIPPPIVDLMQELWQRALAAAMLDLQHGPAARRVTAKAAEIESLRTQLNAVRQHFERESLAYGGVASSSCAPRDPSESRFSARRAS